MAKVTPEVLEKTLTKYNAAIQQEFDAVETSIEEHAQDTDIHATVEEMMSSIEIDADTTNWVVNGRDTGVSAKGLPGEDGKNGFTPEINVSRDTATEFILEIINKVGTTLTTNLRGKSAHIFTGTLVTGEMSSCIADVTDSSIGDLYINTDTSNYYTRDDANNVNNSWCYQGCLEGKEGKTNYQLALDHGFVGTEEDYLASLVSGDLPIVSVDAKPNIEDDATELKTWYWYKDMSGEWVRTIYIGHTKDTAKEITLALGSVAEGYVTLDILNSIAGLLATLKTIDKTSLVNAINELKDLIRTNNADTLNTIAQDIFGAINELEGKHYLDVYDLQGGSVLDYAKTFQPLTHNFFYANNCSDLPTINYGYCSVDVSQDPLYRNVTFYCPDTGRIFTNTIGANEDGTDFGEWSGWHEPLLKEDIATTLDSTVTNKQVIGAKDFYNHSSTRNIKTYTEFYQIGLERLTCSILDTINALPSYSLFEAVIDPSGVAVIAQECPYKHGTLMINKAYPDRVKLYYFPNSDLAEGKLYFCEYHPSTGLSKWRSVHATSVPDTSGTIALPNTLTYASDTEAMYHVIDGVCYVHLWLRSVISSDKVTYKATIQGLPRTRVHKSGDFITENTKVSGIYLLSSQTLNIYKLPTDVADNVAICFSYPVAEDWRP